MATDNNSREDNSYPSTTSEPIVGFSEQNLPSDGHNVSKVMTGSNTSLQLTEMTLYN